MTNITYQAFKKGDSVPNSIESVSLTKGSELIYLRFGVDCIVEFVNGTPHVYPVNTPKSKNYAVIEAKFSDNSVGCGVIGAPTFIWGEEAQEYKENIKQLKAIYKAITKRNIKE